MDKNVEIELKNRFGDDFDIIVRMLDTLSLSDSSRKKKESIRTILEEAADAKGVQTSED